MRCYTHLSHNVNLFLTHIFKRGIWNSYLRLFMKLNDTERSHANYISVKCVNFFLLIKFLYLTFNCRSLHSCSSWNIRLFKSQTNVINDHSVIFRNFDAFTLNIAKYSKRRSDGFFQFLWSYKAAHHTGHVVYFFLWNHETWIYYGYLAI